MRSRWGIALPAAALVVFSCAKDPETDDGAASADDAGTAAADTGADDQGDGQDDGDGGDDGGDDSAPGTTSSSGGDSSSSGGTDTPPNGATEEGLKVAFFGDQGLGSDSVENMEMILEEGADFLVILGDFDYSSNPDAWNAQLEQGLGSEYPVFAAAGNHDEAAWDGYQPIIEARQEAIEGAACEGEVGINNSCLYKGLHFIESAVGTMGSGHEDFIEQQFSTSDAIWKVCAWHKNQNDMQAGGKGNEVGWEAYRTCMEQGAIIATGHEHSYSRTLSLDDLGQEDNGHGAYGDPAVMQVGPGHSFVFTSGLGGASIRDYHAAEHDDDTWWATIYTNNYYLSNGEEIDSYDLEIGVLFVEFYVDGDPYKARGYFKNLNGFVVDEFEIIKDRP